MTQTAGPTEPTPVVHDLDGVREDYPHRVPEGLRTAGGYAWRLIVIAIVAIAVLTALGRITTLVVALFFAVLIAGWLMPLVSLLSRRMPRPLAVVVSLILFVLVLGGMIAFVAESFIANFGELQGKLRQGINELNDWLQTRPLGIEFTDLHVAIVDFEQYVGSRSGELLLSVAGRATTVFDAFTAAMSGLFALLFLLLQPQRMFTWAMSWVSGRYRPYVSQAGIIAWGSFSGYTRALLLVAATDALAIGIGLYLLGVPLAGALTVLVFIGAFIPVIGAPLATAAAALVAFAENGLWAAVIVIGLIVLVIELEGHVLQPLIVGRTVSLHPLAIVLLVSVGVALAGIIGALVIVPIAAAAYAVLRYLAGRDPSNPLPGREVATGSG